MFSSVSNCTPASEVASSFVAAENLSVDLQIDDGSPSAEVKLFINGTRVLDRPAQIDTGDIAEIVTTSPADYLGYKFIPYSLDGIESNIAVVNKTQHFVSFTQDGVRKRWYDYLPSEPHTISFTNHNNELGYIRQLGDDIAPDLNSELFAVPDPQSNFVYFYNRYSLLIDRIELPDRPIAVIPVAIPGSDQYWIATTASGQMYRISVDRTSSLLPGLLSSTRTVKDDWIFEIHFETDIPVQGDILSIARLKIASQNPGLPGCIAFGSSRFWTGSFNRVDLLSSAFANLAHVDVPGAVIFITVVNQTEAVAVTATGLLIKLTYAQSTNELSFSVLYSGTWLSNPVVLGQQVIVSDSERSQIVVFDTATNYSRSELSVGDFSPSYLSISANKVLICGHDSAQVKTYDGSIVADLDVNFPERVTAIFPTPVGFIASHYLKNTDVLDHRTQATVSKIEFPEVYAPAQMTASTQPQQIKFQFSDTFTPSVPAGHTVWVDGEPFGIARQNSYISVSAHHAIPGKYSVPVIIGSQAVDCIFNIMPAEFFSCRNTEFNLRLSSVDTWPQWDIEYQDTWPQLTPTIDYGLILRNFNPYDGSSAFEPGDVLSIVIPFGTTVNNAVSVLSLGNERFYLPVNNNPTVIVDATETKNVLAASTRSFVIAPDEAGKYYIPETFDSSSTLPRNASLDIITGSGAEEIGHGAESLNVAPIDETANYYRVPSSSGVMDIVTDIGPAQIVKSVKLMARYSPVNDPGPPPTVVYVLTEPPTDFEVLGSNNSIDWTVVNTFTGIPANSAYWPRKQYVEFALSSAVPYRYWRLRHTTVPGSGTSLVCWAMTAEYIRSDINVNGQPVTERIIDLAAGDVVEMTAGPGTRIYDRRNIIISGPKIFEHIAVAANRPTIDRIYFGTIDSPTVRNTYATLTKLVSGLGTGSAVLRGSDSATVQKNGSEPQASVTVTDGDYIALNQTVTRLNEASKYFLFQEQGDINYDDVALVDVGEVDVTPVSITGTEKEEYINREHSPIAKLHVGSMTSFSERIGIVLSMQNFHDYTTASSELSVDPIWISELGMDDQEYNADHAVQRISEYASSEVVSDNTQEADAIQHEYVSLAQSQSASTALHEFMSSFNSASVDYFGTWIERYSLTGANCFQFDKMTVKEAFYTSFGVFSTGENFASVDMFETQAASSNFYSLAHFEYKFISQNYYQHASWQKIWHRDVSIVSQDIVSSFVFNPDDFKNYTFTAFNKSADNQSVLILDRFVSAQQADKNIITSALGYNVTSGSSITYSGFSYTFLSSVQDIPQADFTEYGAWATEAEAAAAAESAGRTPFETVQITGTTFYTYRWLLPDNFGCPLFDTTKRRAVSGLLGGG